VDAILAWQVPTVLPSYAWGPLYAGEAEDFEEDAKKILEAVISEEVGRAYIWRVRSRVVQGHPAEVLLDAAAGADLLVVGSRGHGAFAEALLGSVGQHCVRHAHCPVLVMRGEPDRAAA
jgi:nucleotide-binding universal stress UspA family protein